MYVGWRKKLLEQIADKICGPCTSPHKTSSAINLQDPLVCECRCELVDDILENIKDMEKNQAFSA
jgi:hypothetical protein